MCEESAWLSRAPLLITARLSTEFIPRGLAVKNSKRHRESVWWNLSGSLSTDSSDPSPACLLTGYDCRCIRRCRRVSHRRVREELTREIASSDHRRQNRALQRQLISEDLETLEWRLAALTGAFSGEGEWETQWTPEENEERRKCRPSGNHGPLCL